MDDSPTILFASEQHCHPVVPRQLFFLPGSVETDMLNLHYISKIAIRSCHNPLDGIRAIRKLRADPIEPTANLIPAFFDSAAESARKSDVIRMGPKRLESCRPSVLEFELRCVKLPEHCLKLFADCRSPP